jgi:hypothetical protein
MNLVLNDFSHVVYSNKNCRGILNFAGKTDYCKFAALRLVSLV